MTGPMTVWVRDKDGREVDVEVLLGDGETLSVAHIQPILSAHGMHSLDAWGVRDARRERRPYVMSRSEYAAWCEAMQRDLRRNVL